jgi:hypothetical protein
VTGTVTQVMGTQQEAKNLRGLLAKPLIEVGIADWI